MMAAADQLAAKRAERWVVLRITAAALDPGGNLELELFTRGIDRVDVALDGRRWRSVDIAPETSPPPFELPGGAGRRSLTVDAFAGGKLVASRREILGPREDGAWGIVDGAPLVGTPAAEIPKVLRFLIAADGADAEEVRQRVGEVLGADSSVAPLFPDAGGDSRLADHYIASGRL